MPHCKIRILTNNVSTKIMKRTTLQDKNNKSNICETDRTGKLLEYTIKRTLKT